MIYNSKIVTNNGITILKAGDFRAKCYQYKQKQKKSDAAELTTSPHCFMSSYYTSVFCLTD